MPRSRPAATNNQGYGFGTLLQPSTGPLRVIAGHPLANGLRSLWLPSNDIGGQALRNLAPEAPYSSNTIDWTAASASAKPTWGTGSIAPGLEFVSANSQSVNQTANMPFNGVGTKPATMAVIARATSVNSGKNFIYSICPETQADVQGGLCIQMNSSDHSVAFEYGASGATWDYYGVSAINEFSPGDEAPFLLIGTARAYNDVAGIVVNLSTGQMFWLTTTYNGGPAGYFDTGISFTPAREVLGATWNSGITQPFDGRIALAAYWDRGFTDDELVSFASNPFGMLAPVERPGLRGGSSASDGTLTATLGDLSLSATGTGGHTGTFTATLGAATLASTGAATHAGTAAPTLGALTLSSTGARTGTADAAITLGAVTLTSTGAEGHTAALTATLGAAALAAAGATGHTGTLAATLGAATLASDGAAGHAATLSVTLGDLALSSTGVLNGANAGDLAVTLGALTLSATGATTHDGALTATLGAATLAASGFYSRDGTLTATLGGIGLSAAASATHGASLAATLGAVTLSGVAAATHDAAAAVTLGALGLSADGAAGHTATFAVTLGDLTLSATGSGSSALDAQLTATLGALTLGAAGAAAHDGQATPVLGAVSLSATGALTHSASTSAALGPATLSAGGSVVHTGQLAVSLGAVTLQATAANAADVIHAQVVATLGAMRVFGTGLVGDAKMPIREAALGAIATHLAAALSDVPVERGRRSDIALADCPRLVVRMQGHEEAPDDAFGVVLLRCQATVEGFAGVPRGAADPDAALEAVLNTLHARVTAALAGMVLPISADDEMQITGFGLDPDVPLIADSAEAVGGFAWRIGFDLRAPALGGYYTT